MNTVTIFQSLRLWFTIVGACLTFLGERYFFADPAHWWLSGLGLALMVLGVIAAVFCGVSAKSSGFLRELPGWRLCLAWQSLLLISYLCYFIYSALIAGRAQPSTFMEKGLLALWVVSGILSVFLGVGTEWAYVKNGRGELAEPQRVKLSAANWFRVGILLVIIASMNYVAVRQNVVWDLSYLKTSSPSQSTVQLMDTLPRQVDVALFFPSGNEVLSKARLYFEELKGRGDKLSINIYDMEINPVEAEAFKASRNGLVVLRSDGQTERIDLGVNLEGARKGLKNLDGEFQKALLAITQKKKVLYFTRGHGELSWVADSKESGGVQTISRLEEFLRSSGYTLRFFGLSDGAANGVPSDADAVVIVGGVHAFMPEEARSIKSYVESGGKLFVLLDVDVPSQDVLSPGVRDASKDPLVKWLKESGADFQAKVLANESNHARGTGTKADVWFLFSNIFTSHASVQTLAKNDQRAALIFLKSGYFMSKDSNPAWTVFDTVRSLSDTFVDENRDFRLNEPAETREPRVIGLAMEQKIPKDSGESAGRIVAFADATLVSDALIGNQANIVYFLDSLRWLWGESSVLGVADSEEDIPIRHSNKEDVVWFYGTIVLVPAFVLLAGRFATSRSRRSRGRVRKS